MGWRGVFWQQAAAGLCIGISFPLGCLPSSEPSSTQPSEPASLWEPLCFSVTCITLIADLPVLTRLSSLDFCLLLFLAWSLVSQK